MATAERFQKDYLAIPSDEPEFHPANIRPIQQSLVDGLVTLMQEKGFSSDHPIIVVKENEKWLVVAGKHRVLAARKAGIPYVFAIDHSGEPDVETEFDVVRSNRNAEFSMIDVGYHFRYMKDKHPDLTQEEYAVKIGRTQAYISQAIASATIADKLSEDPEIGDRIRELKDSALMSISRAPETDQRSIAKKALEEGLSVVQVNEEVYDANERKKYKESALEEGQERPEPRREICFKVPLSMIETVRMALRRASQITESDDPGINLYEIASAYDEHYGENNE